MPARLPSDLLDRSAPEAVRVLGLSYLDQIDQARLRLSDALDQEALHDFRVGLRRLRSSIRAYRGELKGSVPNKTRRQLRNLGRATNKGRDVEVQLTWLGKQVERLGNEDVRGFFWLAGRLEERKQKTHDRAVGVARQYEKIGGKLRKALSVLRIDLATSPGPRPASFQEVIGTLALQHVGQVRDDLGRIRDPSDAEHIHQARISLKRLRYLLEPVGRRNRRAGVLVRRLKEAQDLLGEHHDMHVLSSAVGSLAAGLSGTLFSGLDPGLATVKRLADESAAESFHRFQSVWGGEMGNRILTRADELGRALQEPSVSGRPPGLEPPARTGARESMPADLEPSFAHSS